MEYYVTRHVMIPWLMTFMYAQTTAQSKQLTFAHQKVCLISKTCKNYIQKFKLSCQYYLLEAKLYTGSSLNNLRNNVYII